MLAGVLHKNLVSSRLDIGRMRRPRVEMEVGGGEHSPTVARARDKGRYPTAQQTRCTQRGRSLKSFACSAIDDDSNKPAAKETQRRGDDDDDDNDFIHHVAQH